MMVWQLIFAFLLATSSCENAHADRESSASHEFSLTMDACPQKHTYSDILYVPDMYYAGSFYATAEFSCAACGSVDIYHGVLIYCDDMRNDQCWTNDGPYGPLDYCQTDANSGTQQCSFDDDVVPGDDAFQVSTYGDWLFGDCHSIAVDVHVIVTAPSTIASESRSSEFEKWWEKAWRWTKRCWFLFVVALPLAILAAATFLIARASRKAEKDLGDTGEELEDPVDRSNDERDPLTASCPESAYSSL